MGTVQVPGRVSGKTYNLKIKGDTPSESEQARIRSFLDEKENAFAADYEAKYGAPLAVDDGTALGRGWERGKASAYSRLGTATEYLGSGLGIESLVGAGQGMRQAGDYEGFLESLRQPAPTELKDVTGIGSALTYVGEGLGQSGPEMLAPLAATTAGTLVGGPAAGLAAGTAAAFPTFFGGNIQRQEQEVEAGRKNDIDVASAVVSAVGQSALNSIADKLMIGGFLKPGQSWLTRVAIGGAEGAAAEVPTEITQQILERKQAGMPLDDDEAISEYVNAGVLGGILGGGIRGTTAGFGIGMEKKTDEQRPEDIVPGTTGPIKPGPAKAISTMVIAKGSNKGTVVRMSDNSTIRIPGDASKADIAKAVAQYNQTKAEEEAVKAAPKVVAPKVVTPTVLPPEPRPAPLSEADAFETAAALTATERAAAAAELDAAERAAEEKALDERYAAEDIAAAEADRIAAEVEPVQKDLFVEPTVKLPTVKPTEATATATAAKPKSAVTSETVVPETGLTLVHGGKPGLTLDAIEIIRPADKMKQGKKGKVYGGFYAAAEEDAAQAVGYAGETGAVYDVRIKPGTKVAEKPGDITRLSKAVIDQYVADGYGVVLGKDPRGRTEFAVLDKNAIEDVAPRAEPTDVTETAETKSEAVGDGTVDGTQGMGIVGGTGSDTEATSGTETPAKIGLEPDMSVPDGAAVSTGEQPAPLTNYAPMTGATPGVTTGVAGQIIPRPIAVPRAAVKVVPQASIGARLVKFFEERASDALKRYTTATGGINNPATWKDFPDWMPLTDQGKVAKLLGRLNRTEREKYKFTKAEVTPLTREEEAAHTYFSKVIRPVDAIALMVDDLTVDYKIYEGSLKPGRTEIEHRDLMMGTGSEVAQRALDWVRANLEGTSAEIDLILAKDAEVNEAQQDFAEAEDRVEVARAKRKADRAARVEAAIESGYGATDVASKMAAADPLAALDMSMHYSVKAALIAGDLKGALQALAATTNNADLRALATRFSELTGTTRVKVLFPGDPSRNIGNARGIFWQSDADPERQNIIYLNGQMGMDNHVLMHEMAHAVTAAIVRNQPNHPVTKQIETLYKTVLARAPLTALYDRSKPSKEFAGLTSVNEFVAELFGRVALGSDANGLLGLMDKVYVDRKVSTTEELPLTARQRFYEIVSNLFRSLIGRPTKKFPRQTKEFVTFTKETARDAMLRLTMGILSEAPQVLPSTVLYSSIGSPMVGRNLLNISTATAPVWGADGKARVWDFLRTSTSIPVRRLVLGALQLDWVADMARGYLPSVDRVKEEDDFRRGTTDRLTRMSGPITADINELANTDPEGLKTLWAVQGEASFTGVDIAKPSSDYIGDTEKFETWHRITRKLQNADSSGKLLELYKKTRNLYAAFKKEFLETFDAQIDALTPDVAQRKSLKETFLKKMIEDGVIDPYFAFMRNGDYWLSYTAKDTFGEPVNVDPTTGEKQYPTMQVVQTFKSMNDRKNFIARLEAETDDKGAPVAWNFESFMQTSAALPKTDVPLQYVQGVMNIINNVVKDSDQNETAVAAIQDLFLRMSPAHSTLRAYRSRKDGGVRGFIGDETPLGVINEPRDIVRALEDKVTNLAYQISNMRHGSNISRAMSDMAKEYETAKKRGLSDADQLGLEALYAEVVERAKFARSPKTNRAAYHVRGVTFVMTLGANIAATINALFQLPMIGFPHLMGMFKSPGKVWGALRFATSVSTNAGRSRRVLTPGADGMEQRTVSDFENYGSIENYYDIDEAGEYTLRTDRKIPKKLAARLADMGILVKTLSTQGLLAHTPAQAELIDGNDIMSTMYKWAGLPMHFAEQYNRQSLAIAAYNLEIDKIRAANGPNYVISDVDKQNAANLAVATTELINGSIGSATNARYAHHPIGSVIYLYKKYGLSMARYIVNSVAGSLTKITDTMTPEQVAAAKLERSVARYQLGGMLGATAIFAGVQGLPFFGEVMSILNLLFTDDDEEDFETIVQKYLQEPFYNGAINYFTGAEVSSRVSMSGLLFRENKIDKNQSVFYDLIEMLGGPTVGLAMNMERGYGLLQEGELYRAAEAFSPSMIKSGLKAYRYGVEGATTARGDEVVPLNAFDIALQAVGYTPEAYARTQEATGREKRIDEAIRNKKRRLHRKYNLAKAEGDFNAMQDVLMEMREFTAEHPEAAITPASLKQSFAQYRKISADMIGGVSFSPGYLEQARGSIGEYDPSAMQ